MLCDSSYNCAKADDLDLLQVSDLLQIIRQAQAAEGRLFISSGQITFMKLSTLIPAHLF